MRVLIDTTYSQLSPHSGTGVYTRMLCAELTSAGSVELIEAANPRRHAPAGGGFGSLRNLLADRWWLSVGLPRAAKRARADVIHHPLPARARTRIAQVITVHDLSFERLPECFDRRFRVYAHLSHRSAARRAAAVICVSRTTAADVRERWRIAPARIVVARHGPGQSLPPPAGAGEGMAEHFLYVGDAEPRKNLDTLLAAYRLYRAGMERPLPLVLAGPDGVDETDVRAERAPTAQRLSDLYAGAAALIQPSLYEGFGLTALEAMKSGTPVLAARSPGLVEICDGAAALADPHDPRSLADAMRDLAASPALRHDLAERGRVRASQFSWEQCAHSHLTAYSLALRRA